MHMCAVTMMYSTCNITAWEERALHRHVSWFQLCLFIKSKQNSRDWCNHRWQLIQVITCPQWTMISKCHVLCTSCSFMFLLLIICCSFFAPPDNLIGQCVSINQAFTIFILWNWIQEYAKPCNWIQAAFPWTIIKFWPYFMDNFMAALGNKREHDHVQWSSSYCTPNDIW